MKKFHMFLLCFRLFMLLVILFVSQSNLIAQIRGELISGACPISCNSLGYPKERCRDWRVDQKCFVEDLSRLDLASLNRVNTVQTNPIQKYSRPKESLNPETLKRKEIEACQLINPYYLAQPKIVIYSTIQPKTLYGGKFKVNGAIEGNCIQSAYYFENGEKKSSLSVETSRSFKRFNFDLTSDQSLKPEIRVVTLNGQRVVRQLNFSNK